MTESISELKKICQKAGGENEPAFDRYVTRRISIRITRFFLALGISANQATLISLVVALVAGAFFTFNNPLFWVGGVVLTYLFYTLDCVDGEISRYRKSSYPGGTYFDGTVGLFGFAYVLACAVFGIYFSLHHNFVFLFGFLAMVAHFMAETSSLLQNSVNFEWGIKEKPLQTARVRAQSPVLRIAFFLYKSIASPLGLRFVPMFLVAAIIDIFASPFMVAGVALDVRFIWLAAWGIATLLAVVAKTILIVRRKPQAGIDAS